MNPGMSVATHRRPQAPWLLLLFSLPAKRASERVGVWRQLQRFGAVALHNSTYLLPENAANRERFEWLATTIRDSGGQASVASSAAIHNLPQGELIERFREARARDYQRLLVGVRRLGSSPSPRRNAGLARLHRRLEEVAAIDFFACPLRERVEEQLERLTAGPARASSAAAERVDRRDYRRRLWVTRPRPGIDRCASAWLVRRFIDRAARFAFARGNHIPRGAVPFDMFHGGFGHRGDDCTFETLEKLFGIRDISVARIAEVVHDADLVDEKFGRKEGFGMDEVLKGWAREGLPDREILERGIQMFDGLYHSLGRTLPRGRT
jgi:hypothetical protein